jgi:Rad3-related DNA helicase
LTIIYTFCFVEPLSTTSRSGEATVSVPIELHQPAVLDDNSAGEVALHRRYLQQLVPDLNPTPGSLAVPDPRRTPDPILIILVFDEAHQLVEEMISNGSSRWSRFGELRRALSQVSKLPLFSLFLSTAGQLHQFTPERGPDPSSRIQTRSLQTIAPFTELDFDIFAIPIQSGQRYLSDLEKTEHMVTFGRPM